MKKLHIALIVFLTSAALFCKAQDKYQPGSVVFKDGNRVAGYILLDDDNPWYNQRYIWFVDSTSYAANPKARGKKYRADDMQMYQAGTRIFDKVHYVNTENLQLKSLGTNDHMMERLSSGRITAHRFYDYPQDMYAGSEEKIKEDEEKNKQEILKGYKILCIKEGEKKPQNAFDIDMLKYLADVPAVQEKYQKGEYGNQPVVPHKGLMSKMVAYAKKNAFKQSEADAIVAAFNDFNAQK
ncbi:MAG TPA: hypothetical protein VIM89_12815 [Mucilaginibacter sp.]